MPRGILFHGRSRDCYIRTGEAALIVSELRKAAFEPGPVTAAADAISDGFVTGEVAPFPDDQAAALQAVLLRLATVQPESEAVTTLHDALALDYGEL